MTQVFSMFSNFKLFPSSIMIEQQAIIDYDFDTKNKQLLTMDNKIKKHWYNMHLVMISTNNNSCLHRTIIE